jgi:hypothetical protein
MVLNATFNNTSVISWQSVLLVEETTDLAKVTAKLYHIMFQVHLAEAGFECTTLVEIGTDCTGSCKSNYHTIMTTTTPLFKLDKPNILKPGINMTETCDNNSRPPITRPLPPKTILLSGQISDVLRE